MVSIMINNINVAIDVIMQEPAINLNLAMNFIPFRNWVANLDPQFIISKIIIQSVDMFGPRIGFLKFQVFGTFNGKPIPGIVFSRGHSIAVLPVLTNIITKQKYVICCQQPRMAAGKIKCEIPAGMMDGDGNFIGVAAKEMKEETGLDITTKELHDLSNSLMYPSIGGCDEGIRFMFYKKEVTSDFLDHLNGKITGNFEEGEVIKLKLIKYEDMHIECDDMKAMTAMLLAERLNFI